MDRRPRTQRGVAPHPLAVYEPGRLLTGLGHRLDNDPSEEPQMVANMRARNDVSGVVIEKILGENARSLYGI